MIFQAKQLFLFVHRETVELVQVLKIFILPFPTAEYGLTAEDGETILPIMT